MNGALRRQKLMALKDTTATAIEYTIERYGLWARAASAASIGVVMAAAVLSFYSWRLAAVDGEFLVASVLLGTIVGARLGTVAAYGLFPRLLIRRRARLNLVPGHDDESGGVGIVGAYFVLQGALVTIVIVWIIVWIALIDFVPCDSTVAQCFSENYGDWRQHFYLLILISGSFLYFGSILPLYQLRRLMAEARSGFADLARRLEREIAEWGPAVADEGAEAALKRIDMRRRLLREMDFIRSLPEFPLGASARKLFTLTNSLPIVGLIVDLAIPGKSQLGKIVNSVVEALAQGLGLCPAIGGRAPMGPDRPSEISTEGVTGRRRPRSIAWGQT
jgi:hypothetical protein